MFTVCRTTKNVRYWIRGERFPQNIEEGVPFVVWPSPEGTVMTIPSARISIWPHIVVDGQFEHQSVRITAADFAAKFGVEVSDTMKALEELKHSWIEWQKICLFRLDFDTLQCVQKGRMGRGSMKREANAEVSRRDWDKEWLAFMAKWNA